MIPKILSNLPYNPSMIEQLAFYSKRLRREQSIRRLGLIMIVLSMFVQIFAAAVPAERSLAGSNNDVIYGGVSGIGDLRRQFDKQADVRALFKHFGLQRSDLNHNQAKKVNFNFKKEGAKGTRTVGRINFTYTKDKLLGKFAGSKFYSRSASEWSGSTKAFYFGKQKGKGGKYYFVWVLKDCGNIAYRKAPSPNPPSKPPKPPEKPPQQPPPPPPEEAPPPNTTPTKEVLNITQELSPTQTLATKAQPGDILEYRLILTNTGGSEQVSFSSEDYIGDILDYADIDIDFLSANGGQYSETDKKVIWSNQNIKPGEQLVNTFRVKVKEDIPGTNRPHAITTQFDCKMQNGFGDEIVVHVNCPVIKTVETLPNTGPGETIAVVFAVSLLSGYFVARNRLQAKELAIIKGDYSTNHGV